jgi:hypothetical protein
VPSRLRCRAQSPRSSAGRPGVCTRPLRRRSCVKSSRNADAARFNRLRLSTRRHERSGRAEVVARAAHSPGTDSNAGFELSSVADLNPEIVVGYRRRALTCVGRIDQCAQLACSMLRCRRTEASSITLEMTFCATETYGRENTPNGSNPVASEVSESHRVRMSLADTGIREVNIPVWRPKGPGLDLPGR